MLNHKQQTTYVTCTKNRMQKIGILGSGQLGRMLLQAAANYPVETFIMDKEPDSPAAHLAHHFIKGDFRDYNDVYNFGKGLDAITIEIESVNEEALKTLEEEGVTVYPSPAALTIIKNKILQKNFYREHNIPTADFVVTNSKEEATNHSNLFPAIHKIAVGGYDGRGIIVFNNKEDSLKAFDAPSVLEKRIDIKKELSVIVGVGKDGQTACYPAVDMVFDVELNLLDYQLSPADVSAKVLNEAQLLALEVVRNLKSGGIFAVEMFVDNEDNVFVNETAPRVHNSGHHTIEANYCSQFDMLLRIMLNYPLGNPMSILPSVIVNILGTPGYEGKAVYEGLDKVLAMDNVFLHIYGKPETRPGRKMGHATIIGTDMDQLVKRAHEIKKFIKVKS